MQKLSLITGFILLVFYSLAQQNPHGNSLTFACTDCHTTEGWTFSKDKAIFNHNKTSFELEGQHTVTNCKACHQTLVFNEAKSNCVDCHTDMHNNTVGPNCYECHTPKSWIIENITEIHQNSRFPLLGAHNTADCIDCHISASKLEFQPLGIDCYDCHRPDYEATTNPSHIQTGLSTNCVECHRIDAFAWSGTGINHDFFPLTKGHEINDCAACHKGDLTQPIASDCFSCHEANYNSTANPSHTSLGFSTNCTDCHTTNPGWKPAGFKEHDALYFPIYSGSHNGEWSRCTDCHTQAGSYNSFSCTDCHEHNKSDMDRKHREENGYVYSSPACFACHPTGRGEGAFNHSATGFPLKGAHVQADCLDCHANGYAGTSPLCASCHTQNYNEATNPSHINAGISNECETCHTEDGWKPSLFNHTVTGFELNGGHSGKQCSACHIGNTTSATSDCFSCHQSNYNSAENHLSQNYPHDCTQCHNTNNWDDAVFDHNATNFPLTGAHIATECSACHTSGYAGTSTLCASCHQTNYNSTANPNHSSLGFSISCEECHTTAPGWEPALMPNHNDYYALNGAHAVVASNCYLCHAGNYTNIPNSCYGCHASDYSSTTDPAHAAAQFSTDCATCHSESAWKPSTFDHDAQYFPIYSGKHRGTWSSCATCHTEVSNYSVFSCLTCHEHNQTSMNDKHHEVNGYVYTSTSCLACHPQGVNND
ncbi:MAG: cytochrome c3 family protein [Draconibacterium sp.]